MTGYDDISLIFAAGPGFLESEIAAMLKYLGQMKPDILGVCEIGSEEDASDLQIRLKNAGIDLEKDLGEQTNLEELDAEITQNARPTWSKP